MIEKNNERINIGSLCIELIKNKLKDDFVYGFIFGSSVEGTFSEESDIDIIIVVKNSTKVDYKYYIDQCISMVESDYIVLIDLYTCKEDKLDLEKQKIFINDINLPIANMIKITA